MPRTIALSLRQELEKQESAEAILCFVAISHPTLTDPLRFVSSPVNHVWGGNTYLGCVFDWQLMTDDDTPPTSRITVQNVDRIAGRYVRTLNSPARIRIDALVASDFDESTDPREEFGTPTAFYTANHLYLVNVAGNNVDIQGELRSWDYVQESWPAVRATQSRLPGVYR